MAIESDTLKSIDAKNQILLEGVKLGQHKKFAPYLKRIDKEVRIAILGAGDIILTKKERDLLVKSVNGIQATIYAEYLDGYTDELATLGFNQASFEAESYESVVKNYNAAVPKKAQVITAYMVEPLQVENYAGKPLLASYMKSMTQKEIDRVNKAVTDGYSQGLTNQQIVTNIRGTKTNRFTDGILNKSNNANASMVRTSIQHVSTQARVVTMKQNDDLIKGYKLVVTFDDRTTTLCYDLGQQDETYEVGKGPMPPLHVGCRDTITPVLSEKYDFLKKGATRASKGASGGKQVSAKLGSYDWMLTQPKSFQEASMGVTRSKLLRDGGLTPTEYAKLSTNSRFQTLTIEQMREKNPSVFESAGL
ncbi:hypothetical protein OAA60_06065 [Porticoccaceae bacterium]|nr:hypothetical protein [Porticoccaceae bacterium]